MSTAELACTYACLILHDDAIPITAEKIATLVKAANLNVESYWWSLFAKLCQKKNIDDLLVNFAAGGAPAPSTAAPSSAAPVAPAAEEEKKEEPLEGSDEENMFSLFD